MPYPSLLLNLPLHAQERLPLALRNIDLEYGLVLHICLAFLTILNPSAPAYNLPLALFGLVASQPSLISGLLPHFLGLWTASIVADVLWLMSAPSSAGGIATLATGINMVFKLVTAGAAARTLKSQGALPEHSAGGIGNWGAAAADRFGSLGLPGNFFGASAGARGGYSDVPGGYQTVYDEEAPQQHATERDADMLPGGQAKGTAGMYRSIS